MTTTTDSGFVTVSLQDEAAQAQRRSTIACVIPAYNEEETIEQVLDSLLTQTRPPDVIHLVINNTTDETFYIARRYAGEHFHTHHDTTFTTYVFIHDIGKNIDKKVGALNYGFAKVAEDFDYLLGVDGDTILEVDTVERLEAEARSEPRIGGISAIYTVDPNASRGVVSSFLTTGQRAQFAAFTMDNLLRGRNMAVLGGQCSLFSIQALKDVMAANRQATPWVSDSEVEDSLLSLQLRNIGAATKVSATARAYVGGMHTVRALDGQQVKWNVGAIDLMWPGQRSTTAGQPFHPNLRLRWMENLSMLFNISIRLGFVLLLAASLSIDAFIFSPWWLIPPAVATLLNLRIALSIKGRRARDIWFALLFIPAEVYLWMRMGHFIRAWAKFFGKAQTDNWAAQANAERGRGMAFLTPVLVGAGVISGAMYAWFQQSAAIQSAILSLGWPVLYITTIAMTLIMVRKALRRHRGFTV
ncbi:glycosyltransferase family 2 protein [Nesterenkonia haasae]|uniref:glycosyltransferase family 2 protein n=1 Tax=Nesterenkonia haasae TaxID=2587813 RepID=UPI001391CE4B|nr:glycosyltransferase family 2 protein [Nesterenkonia haasae]NDK32757.1 glycosyltransferase family 2 protein [Nesterenkonia haasae]